MRSSECLTRLFHVPRTARIKLLETNTEYLVLRVWDTPLLWCITLIHAPPWLVAPPGVDFWLGGFVGTFEAALPITFFPWPT